MISRGIGSILFTVLIVMVSACGSEPAATIAAEVAAPAAAPSGPAEIALSFRKQWQRALEDNNSVREIGRLRVTANKLFLELRCVRIMETGQVYDVTAALEIPFSPVSSDTIQVSESFYKTVPWYTAGAYSFDCQTSIEAGVYQMKLATDQSAIGLYLNNAMKFHYYKLPGT